jgi:hypothetical protein
MNLRTKRRILPILAASAALATAGALAAGGASAASAQAVSAQEATSANWAGYVVHSNAGDGRFSSVSGSWVVPIAGGQGYSAFWVGLGGSSSQSQALEQVGTSSDTVDGQTQYYAWYELVPAPETQLNLAVQPGDHITGEVNVSGSTVTVSLSDRTTGQSVTKQLQMSNPDTSSAEWIAEAPSSQTQFGNFQPLPLADFGSVMFTGASATSDGHSGSISDPAWSVQQVQLAPSGGGVDGRGAGIAGGQFVSGQSSGGAQASSLSSDGSSFSVSYNGANAEASGYGAGGGYVVVTPDGYAYVVPGGYYGYGM